MNKEYRKFTSIFESLKIPLKKHTSILKDFGIFAPCISMHIHFYLLNRCSNWYLGKCKGN